MNHKNVHKEEPMKFRAREFAPIFLFSLLLSVPAQAATTELRVLFDVDNNPATGCVIGNMPGVEMVLVTVVNFTESSGTVTSVYRQECLGAPTPGDSVPVHNDSWPIGMSGSSGNISVETSIPVTAFGSMPWGARVGFSATFGSIRAELLTRANGDPIIWPTETNSGRRRAGGHAAGATPAHDIVLDGSSSDWGMIDHLAQGVDGSPKSIFLQKVRATAYIDELFFVFDARVTANTPVADDDNYTVRQGKTLNVAAPGVLDGDTDPNNQPLSAVGVTNPVHGNLVLNANGGFVYINDGVLVPSDSFEYKATNGGSESNVATVTINITPNGVPDADPETYNVAHRGTLTVPAPGVLANDDDPDHDSLRALLTGGVLHGTLALNQNGSFTYTHDGTNSLSDRFLYRATDGISSSSQTQVSIVVGPDTPPVGVADAHTVAEGGTLTVVAPGVLGNDTDVDTPAQFWNAANASTPANGSLTLNANGSFTYVHNGSETASDSFTYQINDGIFSSPATPVTITITPVNDTPVANADAYTTNEDQTLTVLVGTGVRANDTDAEGTPLTIAVGATTTNGALTLNADGSFNYQPNANFNGSDSFTYTASDGTNTSAPATVTITVNAVNDAPSYTGTVAVDVLEDSGAHGSAWASAISRGPADEAGQTLTFNITGLTNAGLFAVAPSIAPDGTLTFTPAANANGTATAQVTLQDNGGTALGGADTSAAQTLTINITAVNDAPSFLEGADESVLEDTGLHTVNNWATSISAGPADEAGQTLTFGVNNDNNALFAVQPAISPAGVLTYTLTANASGMATVTIVLSDNGGTANAGIDASAPATLIINVTDVNDEPTFTGGGNVTVDEDSGAYSNAWASAISAGPPAENAQTVTFNVTNNNSGYFSVQPAISPAGLLTFTLAANATGTATVSATLVDNGGIANAGDDTSATVNFDIIINAVNDAPSFSVPATAAAVNEDAGLQTVNGFASSISAGPVDEAGQTLTFNVNVTAADGTLTFATPPAIDASGNLTYAAAGNAYGSATVSVTLSDNGSNTPPNANASAAQSFTITINPVNDEPSFAILAPPPASNEDGGLQTVNGFASSITNGPNEAGQTSTFGVTQTGGTLTFATAPAIDATGNLTYTAAANAFGTATFDVVLTDDGSNTPPNDNTSATLNFTITVNNVNDAPVITSNNTVGFTEGGGAVTLNGSLTITDIDSGTMQSAAILISGNAGANDTLACPACAGLGLTSLYNGGSSTLDITGNASITDYQTALRSVTFDNPTDAPALASRNIDWHVTDNSAAISVNSANNDTTITITATNDAPSNTMPGGQTADEDIPYTLSGANAPSISDPDALATDDVQVTLNVGNGIVSLDAADTGALTSFTDGTNTVVAVGTIAELNAAMDGMTFTGNPNYNGPATIQVVTNDMGNKPSGALSDTDTISITVNPINDQPSFSVPATAPAVDEDSGAASVSNFATSLSAGPADEAGQTLSFNISNDNNALFSTQPALDASGNLTYTPAGNAFGTVTVTVSLSDNGSNVAPNDNISGDQTFTITVNSINDEPSFTIGGNPPAVDEDAGAQTVNNFATSVSAGPSEGGQTVTFTVTQTGGTLTFTSAPSLDASGNLTYTTAGNANGTATFDVYLTDNGSNTPPNDNVSGTQSFTITANPVNDEPSFSMPASAPAVNEDSGAATASSFATSISTGPADEAGQTLTFAVVQNTIDSTLTFDAAPAIDASGNLTYTPASNAYGTATYNVTLTDNGSNVVPNDNTSATATLTITVTSINDAPQFTIGGNPAAVNEDAGGQTVNGFASGITSGPNESSQTVSFAVTQTGGTLTFTTAPAIDASGNLTYTTAGNANGTATFDVVATDSGSNTPPNVNTTTAQSFTITANAVNDAPSFSVPASAPGVDEDSGAASVSNFATSISAGPADEAGQTLTFNVVQQSADATLTFSGAPAISSAGTLTYTPNANAYGTATFNVTLSDNGSGVVPNVNTSGTQSFTITVGSINDAPQFTIGGNPAAVNEDAGGQTVNSFATGITSGPNEAGQTVSFTVTQTGGTLTFSTPPAISAAGVLTYTTAGNANGTATFDVYATDDGSNTPPSSNQSGTQSFTITANAVNDEPTFSMPASAPAVDEDSGAASVSTFATSISAGPADEAGQTLTFAVVQQTIDATLTFSSAPAISSAGTLSYTPAANAYGTATYNVTLTDNGSNVAPNDNTSTTATLTITVTSINDAPQFTIGGNPATVLEDAGGQTVNSFATSITSGANESGQTVSFTVTQTGGTLTFSSAPSISAAGVLTYTTAGNANGTATFDVYATDNGSSTPPNVNQSTTQSFTITATAVNDEPTFSMPASAPAVDEDSGAASVSTFATSISAGPADEAGQTLTFAVVQQTIDATLTFSSAPAINSAGTLSYTPAANAYGTATYNVILTDNGSNVAPNDNTSSTHTLTITVNSVNDEPTFTIGANPPTVLEDAGLQTVNGFASSISVGVNESGQTLTFAVTQTGGTLTFSGAPAISPTGQLTYTSALNSYGTATFDVVATDNGSNVPPNDNTSATATFTITVSPVNDPPTVGDKTHITHSGIGFTITAATHTGELKEGAADVDDHDPFSELTIELRGTPNPNTATVSLISASDGSFYYEPPGGLSGAGAATFQFRVCDNGDVGLSLAAACSADQTVTLNITGPDRWFFDPTPAVPCAASCNGSNTKPYASISSLPVVGTRGTGDQIFLGTGTYTGLGHTFAASELLVGEGASGTFDGRFGTGALANGTLDTRPALTNNSANWPILQNTVTFANAAAMRGVSVNSAGNVGLSGSGNSLISIQETSVNSSTTAINFTNVTTSAVAGSDINISSVTSSGGTNGIMLDGLSGNYSLGGGTLSGQSAGGAAFRLLNSGNSTITYSGTVTGSGTNVRAVHIGTTDGSTVTNNATGLDNASASVTFSGAVSGGGIRVYESTGGTVNFSNATNFNTSTANAIELIDNNGTTINFSGGSLNVDTTSGKGITASAGGTVNVTGANNTVDSTTGRAVELIGTAPEHMAGNHTFLSVQANGADRGMIYNFHDGLVSVTGSGSTTGSGGTIQNISVRGVEFANMSATGTTVSLRNMDFVNANTTDNPTHASTNATGLCGTALNGGASNSECHAAIHFNTVSGTTLGASLLNVNVSGTSSQQGINAFAVSGGMTMDDINVSGAGNGASEGGLDLQNLTGTVTLTNSTITNSFSRNIKFVTVTGTVAFNVSNSTISLAQNSSQGLIMDVAGTSSASVTVNGSTQVINNKGNGLDFTQATAGSSLSIVIQSNTLTNNNSGVVINGTGGTTNYNISSNSFATGANSTSCTICLKSGVSGNVGATTRTINGNTFGTGATNSASCGNCTVVNVAADGTPGLIKSTITNNNFNGIGLAGVYGTIINSSRAEVVITGNSFTNPNAGITVSAIQFGNTHAAGCTALTLGSMASGAKNTLGAGSWVGGIDIDSSIGTFKFANYVSGDPTAYVTTHNTFTGGAAFVTAAVTGGTTCP
jgi:VCBS repeat-containing protein